MVIERAGANDSFDTDGTIDSDEVTHAIHVVWISQRTPQSEDLLCSRSSQRVAPNALYIARIHNRLDMS